MQELDPRLVKLSIEVNDKIKTYQDLQISASGTKYSNPLQNECEVKIDNLDKATQDAILSDTSPYNFNRTPKSLTLEAGRKSYGTSVIYKGNIVTANLTQPPDIGVTLKCLTSNFFKGNVISKRFGGSTPLSIVSKQLADEMGLILKFEATNKNISNYQYSGATVKEVNNLSAAGNVNVYVDNGILVVKDANVPLSNSLRILSAETGMIGIPSFTEQGIKVKFLLDNRTTLGGNLRIKSLQYPATNGDYTIYKLSFEIANRDTPFYWIAEGKKLA